MTVTITEVEYARLLKAEATLLHLEANGVDNWSGYSTPGCAYCGEWHPDMDTLETRDHNYPYGEIEVCKECQADSEFKSWYAKRHAK